MLDISGSMSSTFPQDSDRRSKLEVAVSCLKSMLPQLTAEDRVAIITFNTDQQVVYELNYATEKNQKAILKKLNGIQTSGGTALARGLAKGFQTLHSPAAAKSGGGAASRSKRVLFLTDMQSSAQDEAQVILLGRNAVTAHVTPVTDLGVGGWGAPRSPIPDVNPTGSAAVTPESIFFSVIGIGVDLSVSTLRQITAIPGARYISASSAEEFTSIVSEEFLYDITPIAFHIRLVLPESVQFHAVYGASELAETPPGASSVTISSEFANPLRADGSTTGGVLLVRLQDKPELQAEESMAPRRSPRTNKRLHSDMCKQSQPNNTSRPDDNNIRVMWVDRRGQEQTVDIAVPLDIPALVDGAAASEPCDNGLRKAVALRQYVSCLEAYALTAADNRDTETTVNPPAAVVTALQAHQVHGLLALSSLDSLPAPIPAAILRAHKYITLFVRLRSHLIAELGACGDSTLMSNNQNILQTVSQVVDLETLELTSRLQELRSQESAVAYDEAIIVLFFIVVVGGLTQYDKEVHECLSWAGLVARMGSWLRRVVM